MRLNNKRFMHVWYASLTSSNSSAKKVGDVLFNTGVFVVDREARRVMFCTYNVPRKRGIQLGPC